MRRLPFWLGVALSALCLYLALRGLRLDEFWRDLQQTNLLWLIPAIAVYFASVAVRAWRWGYMLRPFKKLSLGRMYATVCIGYMGNNIYPARIGEIVRAYSLNRSEGVPVGTSLATVFMERLIDGIVMVGFVLVALPSVPNMNDTVRTIVTLASAVFVIGAAVFFGLALAPKLAEQIAGAIVRKVLPARFQDLVMGFVQKFVDGAQCLRRPTDLLILFVTTIVIWLMETVKYWLIWHGFSANAGYRDLPFIDFMLFNGVANLSTIIPSGPGYIGTYEAAGVAIFSALGIDQSLAVAYTLVMHIALWLPVTLLGGFFMLREGLRWTDLGALSKERRALSEGS
jgi:hypothetical protein